MYGKLNYELEKKSEVTSNKAIGAIPIRQISNRDKVQGCKQHTSSSTMSKI